MRQYCLLMIIALLGCNKQDAGQLDVTDPSSTQAEDDLQFLPKPTEIEVDQSFLRDMDILTGTFKSDTMVLVSMDASSTVDDMLKAIEEKNHRRLAQYEKMGWAMSVTADTDFLAFHADDYPYIRIQLDGGHFDGRRGYVHKKYLNFDDKGLTLRYFTSERGKGKKWRSR